MVDLYKATKAFFTVWSQYDHSIFSEYIQWSLQLHLDVDV